MQVLNKYRDKIPSGAVVIMRPGFWGNPFSIGSDGSREEVLAKYREWFDRMLQSPQKDVFMEALAKLAEAPALVCCCKPQDCHGDILIEKMQELGLLEEACSEKNSNSA
jgi:hypothetical protein